MPGRLPLPKHITAWQTLNFLPFGSRDLSSELHLTSTRRLPILTRPDHVLVKVRAASLNPVDLLMLSGYGSSGFKFMRRLSSTCGLSGLPDLGNSLALGDSDFPLTPGRDFVGEIVDVGPRLVSPTGQTRFAVGSRVVGATWPFLSSTGSGALAEYLVCPSSYVAHLPQGMCELEATGLGYAGLTAWSALVNAGGLKPKFDLTKEVQVRPNQAVVLITGASGVVGFIAAQLAQMWGYRVHVTCPSDDKAIEMMNSLKVEEVFVHPDKPHTSARYDVIVDCIRPPNLKPVNTVFETQTLTSSLETLRPSLPPFYAYLKSDPQSRYVNLNPPILVLADQWGPIWGTGAALAQLAGSQCLGWVTQPQLPPAPKLRWGFFMASGSRLGWLLRWASQGLIRIPIDSVYKFDQTIQAFGRLQAKGVRGKIVIRMDPSSGVRSGSGPEARREGG